MPKIKDIAVVIRKQEKEQVMSNTITTPQADYKEPLTPSQPNHTDFNKKVYTLVAKERVANASGSHFKNLTKVLLEHDTDKSSLELYGCDFCLSLSGTLTGVRIHMGRIHNRQRLVGSKAVARELSKQNDKQVVTDNPVKAIQGLVSELEYWKALALSHQERLAKVRVALTEE